MERLKMAKNINVQDVIAVVGGCNQDGELLPVSIIKACFSDLRDMAIEIYEGKRSVKCLSSEDEKRFFMAYNASRIHMLNYIIGLDSEENAEHLSPIYEPIIDARNNLSLCNNRLVRKCISNFYSINFGRNNGGYIMQKREECYGEAYNGLLNAVGGFDYMRGNKFSTYAYRAINNSLYKISRDEQILYLSELEKNGFELDIESCVIIEQEECNSEKMCIIHDIIHSGFKNVDLDMSDIDRDIIRLHIDPRNNFTNEDIGMMFNLNRETVRMRKIKGLKKIKSYLKRKLTKK
jgi:RNA polymerase sigma factor (sigma-70 family)